MCAGLPDYLVIPRFLDLQVLPDRRGRVRRGPSASDDDVREMRRLHEQEGRGAKWVWQHFEKKYSYSYIKGILRGELRAGPGLEAPDNGSESTHT